MKSKKINRLKEDLLTEDDIKPENVKWNITIRMSGDLVDAYRVEAEKLGIGYQTLMQMRLREALDKPLIKRVEALEQKLKKNG